MYVGALHIRAVVVVAGGYVPGCCTPGVGEGDVGGGDGRRIQRATGAAGVLRKKTAVQWDVLVTLSLFFQPLCGNACR